MPGHLWIINSCQDDGALALRRLLLRSQRRCVCRPVVLVVLCFEFEVALRMLADWAHFGCLLAYDDVSAVAAFPDAVALTGEHYALLDVVQQAQITLLVVLLHCCHASHCGCYFGESFLVGFVGHV